jgi:uncharacterized membrane protein YhaH (DUF805 family)
MAALAGSGGLAAMPHLSGDEMRGWHLFDRTRLGCVGRFPYWRAVAVHAVLLIAVFVAPFEIFYRLDSNPDGIPMTIFLYGWLAFAFVTAWCLMRLTGRRLADAGFARGWRWLVLVPVLGWLALLVMLLLPTKQNSEFLQ